MATKEETDRIVEEIAQMIERGEVAVAKSRLDQLLLEHPGDHTFSFVKATMFANCFPPFMAADELRAYCKSFPKDSEGPVLLAWVHLREGNADRALNCIMQAEAIGRLRAYGRRLKIQTLQKQGRTAEAQALSDVEAAKPGDGLSAMWARSEANPPVTEAEMLVVVDRMRELEGRPEPVARFACGWYSDRGELDKAEEVLREALAERPLDRDLNWMMANLEYRLNRRDECLARMISLIERDPTDIWAARWVNRYYLSKFRFIDCIKVTRRNMKALKDAGLMKKQR